MTDNDATSPGFSAPMPGHSTRAKSNALYRKNLAKGQTGLSVAFDLPTQTGYDSDHVARRAAKSARSACRSPISATCGRCSTDIPLAEMNTSMTINAHGRLAARALYRGGRRAGRAARHAAPARRRTTSSRNISRAAPTCFRPAPSMRLIKDTILFTTRGDAEVESDECLLLSSAGSGRDAGAGTRLCARDRDRDARHGEGLRRGAGRTDFGEVVGRISFFVNAGMRFITEMCKMRAFVRVVGRDHARALRRRPIRSSGCFAMACR